MRQFLAIVLPVILPIAVYWLYMNFARKRAEQSGTGEDAPSWDDAPWIWLGTAGVVLLIASLMWFRFSSGYDRDTKILPPQLIDGEVQPARPVEKDE